MSDQNNATPATNEDQDNGLVMPDELTVLKDRATALGIKFSQNIGLEALRQRVNDHMNDVKPAKEEVTSAGEVNEGRISPEQAKAELRQKMKREQLRLVRVRIACLNPDKAEWNGEILCVANKFLGEVKKFIPFGEATEDGYHIPYILYNQLKSRKFLQIKTRRNRTNGNIEVTQKWVPEFAIDVLDPLDKDGLKELAAAQAAAGGVS